MTVKCHRCPFTSESYREMALHFDAIHEPEIIDEIVRATRNRAAPRESESDRTKNHEDAAPCRERERQ